MAGRSSGRSAALFALQSGQNGSVVSPSLVRMLELHRAGDITAEGGNSINAVVGREGEEGREGERRSMISIPLKTPYINTAGMLHLYYEVTDSEKTGIQYFSKWIKQLFVCGFFCRICSVCSGQLENLKKNAFVMNGGLVGQARDIKLRGDKLAHSRSLHHGNCLFSEAHNTTQKQLCAVTEILPCVFENVVSLYASF